MSRFSNIEGDQGYFYLPYFLKNISLGMLSGKAVYKIRASYMFGSSILSLGTNYYGMKCNKKKGYIILGYNEKLDKYYGYVEHSFSMGTSETNVQVYTTLKESCWKDYYRDKRISIFKVTNPNSVNQLIYFWLREKVTGFNRYNYNDCIWKVYRIGSKSCPVIVDMSYVKLLNNRNKPWNKGKKIEWDKFLYRNQPFKRK